MKILSEVKPVLSQYGYKKNGDSFWKKENGFYKLIHFQKGAYGSYFFINVGLHPNGLPMLWTRQLCLLEKPKESQCVLRQRVEQISHKAGSFGREIGYPEEIEILRELLLSVIPDMEAWLNKWGSYKAILTAEFDEISRLFSVAPVIWKKEFWLLKSYCALQEGDRIGAKRYFSSYQTENSDMDFSFVDDYMNRLIF